MRIDKERLKFAGTEAHSLLGDYESIDSDYSFGSFLRAAVVNSGVTEASQIISMSSFKKLRATNVSGAIEFMKEDIESNSISFYIFEVPADSRSATAKRDSSSPLKFTVPEGWTTFDGGTFAANEYLSQFARSRVIANYDKKRVVAFVEGRARHFWVQALESILPRIATWLFDSLTKEEIKNLCVSLSFDPKEEAQRAKEENMISYCNEAFNKIDFREAILHKHLDGVADARRKRQIRECEDRISSITEEIEDYTNSLADRYERLDENNVRLAALLSQKDASSEVYYRFFEEHKNISIFRSSESHFYYGVDDTLSFYDSDELLTMIENENSFLRCDYDEDFLKIFKDLFVDKRGLFKVKAVFDLRDFKLVVPIRSDRDDGFYEGFGYDCMPNPHIFYYACSGGNDKYYSQYAKSGDWDLAIEQSISATKTFPSEIRLL